MNDELWQRFEAEASAANAKIAAALDIRSGDVAALQALSYNEYLYTEHWRAVRDRELEYAEHRCRLCNADGQLHVHHRTYQRLGQERPADVIALCADCHRKFHS